MSTENDVSMPCWSHQEFETLDLGDNRLTRRLIAVASALSASPQSTINAACEDWSATKAAYRLFDNEQVAAAKILSPHFQRTVERMRAHERVFAIQDTTYLDYTHHPSTEGLGPIGTDSQHIYGFVKHTTLVVTESGLPLGCLTDAVWVRDTPRRNSRKANAPLTEKESYKWIDALNQTQACTPDGVEVISICDREADIYEFFVQAKETPFVIRAAQNRNVDDEAGQLWASVQKQPAAGEQRVEVPARGNQPARHAVVRIHFTTTTLLPPYRPPVRHAQDLPPVEVSVVWVTEVNPPVKATPLEWLLITNSKVNDFDQAIQRIRWYRMRWQIEVYFKVLKSGTKIEHCRLQTQQQLRRYIALMSVIAWRLYWVTMYNRHAPDAECTAVLTDDEWKALYCIIHKTTTLPNELPTVSQATVWIAKLGGFLARKADGAPGVTVIWRGWQRLNDISDAFILLHNT